MKRSPSLTRSAALLAFFVGVGTALGAQLGPVPSAPSGGLPDGSNVRAGPSGRNPVYSPTVTRVNLGSSLQEAAGATDAASLSDDGQWVAFSTVAANLLGSDGSGLRDVFLRHVETGDVVLISHDALGDPANGASGSTLDISADGRFVAFDSWASDLVPGDVLGTLDVFVFDRETDTLALVSKSSTGERGNAPSSEVSISADGSQVVFSSWSDNLIDGDVNGLQDVFVHELQTGTTWRVSEDQSGVGGIGPSHSPDISATGRFVAYSTTANNLVDEPLSWYHYIFVHDAQTGETWHASKNSLGEFGTGDSATQPAITADGRYVVFASQAYNLTLPGTPDTNWVSDIFVHDHMTGLTRRVSVATDGSEAVGGSIQPAISADGSTVAFMSGAANLVSDDTNTESDVFVHDLSSGQTWCVSRGLSAGVANAGSDAPSLSADGSRLVFGSVAGDLVWDDGNVARDVFLCELP